MLRAQLYDPAGGPIEQGGRELVDAWQARRGTGAVLWIDLQDEPPAEERRLLRERFEIPELAITDAARERHPPKLERFEHVTFLLLKGLGAEASTEDFCTLQLAFFCGEDFLITRHSADSPSTDRAWTQASTLPAAWGDGPGRIVLRIARNVVDRYLELLLAIEHEIEAMESALLTHPDDRHLARLTQYKLDLMRLRRVASYHQRVFLELRTEVDAGRLWPSLVHEATDVFEQMERSASLAGLYYELCRDLLDSYLSVASHRLNGIMKLLTIITAIFVPLSFIAGVYGMNFQYMPELGARSGYFVVLGVMATLVLVLLLFFRRRRWL